MGSSFQEQMQADLAVFFNTDEFAQDVSYDDGNGIVTVQGIVDFGETAKEQARVATIEVQKSQVPAPG